MHRGGEKAGKKVTDGLENSTKPASKFHRRAPLLSNFKKTLAIGLLSTVIMFTPISLASKENENSQKSQQEQKGETNLYDVCWKPDFLKDAPGFGWAGNPIGLADETLAQLGIKAFSGNEKIVSVRSPVGWIHYVMNEGWKGVLLIIQPTSANGKLGIGTLPVDDGSTLSTNYAVDDDGNFAVLTKLGIVIYAPKFDAGGYIGFPPVLGDLTGAKLSVKTVETPTGERTTVEIGPLDGKYARVDFQTGAVETVLASN